MNQQIILTVRRNFIQIQRTQQIGKGGESDDQLDDINQILADIFPHARRAAVQILGKNYKQNRQHVAGQSQIIAEGEQNQAGEENNINNQSNEIFAWVLEPVCHNFNNFSRSQKFMIVPPPRQTSA